MPSPRQKKDPEKEPAPSELPVEYGGIVSILHKDGYLSEQQVAYAVRIHSKLQRSKPLLEVLKELKYVQDEDIRSSIQKNRSSLRLGDLLVEVGLLSGSNLERALEIQKKTRPYKKLGEILIEQRFVEQKRLFDFLSLHLGYPYVEPQFTTIDRKLFGGANHEWYLKHTFVPIRKEGDSILCAFADPLDAKGLDAARDIFKTNIAPAIAQKRSILEAIKRMHKEVRTGRTMTTDDDSVVGLVNSVLIDSIKEGNVSDIHIEPQQDRIRIRFRQDGVLTLYKELPLEVQAPFVSRIKIMCGADIAEKRRHQDGRIFFDHPDMQMDLRVSFYVTVFGEKIVFRLLKRHSQVLDISNLGMMPRMLDRYLEEALGLPSGVVIMTGPTGSGKTSSVYSSINHIKDPRISIITAEDPVEYIIEGIGQCSINPKINLTFEETLKAIVRQDPDVVVIGEIRDRFSAEMAVQTALTGHKVLTTFHTEDSIGALVRLLDMGIEPFLIASTVKAVIAQRLLRKICPECTVPYQPTPTDIRRLGYATRDVAGIEFFTGEGCPECRNTGYKGRIAVLEMLILDDRVRDAVLARKSSYEIRTISLESAGLVNLMEDGILKAALGITSLDEVIARLPRVAKPRPIAELNRILGGDHWKKNRS
jgi:type IV pilus assembly protein PilB